MSTRKTVVLTTSAKPTPAASSTAPTLRSTRSVCSSTVPGWISPVAGSSGTWPAQNTRSPRDDGLAVRADRGRCAGGRDGLAGHGASPSCPASVRMVVAMIDGGPSPIDGIVPSSTAACGRSPRLLAPRRAKDRASTASGRSRTARSAGRAPGSGRAGRRPDPARRGSPPAGGRWPTASTPARARRSVADRPLPSSWARCAEVIRIDPSPLPACAVEHREHVRRADRHTRRHEQDARVAVDAGERRDAARRGPRPGPGRRPGRTARPTRCSQRRGARRVGVDRVGAPRLRARHRRPRPHPTTRRRARPRPGCASRAGRRAAASRADRDPRRRPSGGGDRPQDEVVLERTGVEAADMQRVRAGRPPRRREASGRRASAERHEHRMQVVEPVGPAPDHRQGQVELGRCEPDDRRQMRVASRRSLVAVDPRPTPLIAARSGRAPRAAPATPRRPGSAAAGRARSRPRRGPRPRVPHRWGAAAPARCGSSCVARGTRPGRGARAGPRRPASSRSSASYGSTTMTADSTAGSGSKASGGTRNATRTRAWYCTKTDR